MFEVDHSTLWDYFRGPGRSFADQLGITDAVIEKSTAQTLAWGVSNVVIRVDLPTGSLVVKQSRRQLRTQIDWFSRLDRIWREVDVQRTLACCVPNGTVPQVLFEDRPNYLYGMEAIEADHRVWKADLLTGRVDPLVATTLGKWLASVHRATTNRPELLAQLGDRVVFDELRLDPFYRYVAQQDARVRIELESLITNSLSRQDCLVLADFSPKNILMTQSGPVVVDFETGHYGDPGFDLGFFLSHVLLKTVRHHDRRADYLELARNFWSAYITAMRADPSAAWLTEMTRQPTFEAQCVRHLGACMLARIDGKSRVDYLTAPWQVPLVREYCHALLHHQVPEVTTAFNQLDAVCSQF